MTITLYSPGAGEYHVLGTGTYQGSRLTVCGRPIDPMHPVTVSSVDYACRRCGGTNGR